MLYKLLPIQQQIEELYSILIAQFINDGAISDQMHMSDFH